MNQSISWLINMLTAFGGSIPSLAIFNQFNIVNRPILFNWQNANEKWKIITKFENQTLAQIKYSCSGQINGKMYIFGGQPDSGQTIRNVIEVVDCGLVDTGITLPWPMAGHSCTTNVNWSNIPIYPKPVDYVYICGSMYANMQRNWAGLELRL